MVAASHIGPIKFELIKIKDSVPQTHQPHFKVLQSHMSLVAVAVDSNVRAFPSSQRVLLLHSTDTDPQNNIWNIAQLEWWGSVTDEAQSYDKQNKGLFRLFLSSSPSSSLSI